MSGAPPFALFIRGSKAAAFDVSDQLGFESDMEALAAVSYTHLTLPTKA